MLTLVTVVKHLVHGASHNDLNIVKLWTADSLFLKLAHAQYTAARCAHQCWDPINTTTALQEALSETYKAVAEHNSKQAREIDEERRRLQSKGVEDPTYTSEHPILLNSQHFMCACHKQRVAIWLAHRIVGHRLQSELAEMVADSLFNGRSQLNP